MSSAGTNGTIGRRRLLFDVMSRHLQARLPREFFVGIRAGASFEQVAGSGCRVLEMPGIGTCQPDWIDKWEFGNLIAWITAELAHGPRGGFDGLLAQERLATKSETSD